MSGKVAGRPCARCVGWQALAEGGQTSHQAVLVVVLLPSQAITRFSHPGLSWTLNPGLEEDEVRRLEGLMGLVLPPELRASFKIHNGQSYHAYPVSTKRRDHMYDPMSSQESIVEGGRDVRSGCHIATAQSVWR